MHRNVSVDEVMIKFKGKSKITQKIPLKSIKQGIKVWILADSVNGYIIDFKVYIGKEGDTVEKNLGMKEKSFQNFLVVIMCTSTITFLHDDYSNT